MLDSKMTGRIIIGLFIATILVGLYIIVVPVKPLKGKDSAAAGGGEVKNLLMSKSAYYPGDTIAVLNIFSPISYMSDEDYFGLRRSGALSWIDQMQSIEDNPNVKAVIIHINSPGGTVAATQEVYNEVKRLREKGKPVVVSMGDLAASGAYYISAAADRIVANPGSLVGSIGVIIAGMDLTGLMQKVGVSYNVIKSGKNKDILSSYRKMTKEEQELLQDMIMDAYDQFFSAVAEGRKIKKDRLKEIADGRIFTGRQAIKEKLVDELGDFEAAVKAAAKLGGIKGEPNVIEIKQEAGGMLKYLTSSFGRLMNADKSITIIKTEPGMIKGNYSPVLYMFEM